MVSIANGESGLSVRNKINALLDYGQVNFASRALFVAAVAAGQEWPDGAIISDGIVSYVASSGATAISDLPGFLPFTEGKAGAHLYHFGTNTTPSTTDMGPALRAAVTYCAQATTTGLSATLALPNEIMSVFPDGSDKWVCVVPDMISVEGGGQALTEFRVNGDDVCLFWVKPEDVDTNGTLVGVNFSGFTVRTFDQGSVPKSAVVGQEGSTAIRMDRSRGIIDNVRFINMWRGVECLASPPGMVIQNCFAQSDQVTSVVPGSAFVAALRRRVGSSTVSFVDDMEINLATSTGISVGETITGTTSSATGVIEEIYTQLDGTTQTVRLSSRSGRFQRSEAFTTAGGSGTIGADVWDFTVIQASGQTIEAGDAITGATSGATGTVESVSGDTSVKVLRLSALSGTFTLNESITVSAVTVGTARGDVGPNHYFWSNTIRITGCNHQPGQQTTMNGAEYCLLLGAIDGMTVGGNRFGGASLASIGIVPQQNLVPVHSIMLGPNHIDPLPGKVDAFGILARNRNNIETVRVNDILIFDTDITGPDQDAIRFEVGKKIFIQNVASRIIGRSLAHFEDVENIMISGLYGDTQNQSGDNVPSVVFDNVDGFTLDDVKLADCYGGISIENGCTGGRIGGQVRVVDKDAGELSIYVSTDSVINVDERADIEEPVAFAASNEMNFPIGRNKYRITGTGDLWEIGRGAGYGVWDGRQVWLTFADVVTIHDENNSSPPGGSVGPNISLGGLGTIRTKADDLIGFQFSSGSAAWCLIGHYGVDGEWTPALTDGTNTDATVTNASGNWHRIGNVVHFDGRLAISSLGTISGALSISGLPHTSKSDNYSAITVGYGGGLNITAGVAVTGRFDVSTSTFKLQKWSATTGTSNLLSTEFTASGEIRFSGSYSIA